MSRGASNPIEEPNMGLPTAVSGLQAMFTPTSATHPGGTVVGQQGVAASGPRIIIPLPAALATATAISTGAVVPTPVAGAAGTAKAPDAPLPSMLVDSEWFYPQAYPKEIQQYLATSFSFRYRPSDPNKIVEDTQEFLRDAYHNLRDIGLDIKIAPGLLEIFNEVTKVENGAVKHQYNESPATSSFYMILAYVVSTLLWAHGGTRPLRSYSQVTYPGVIMASYVVRMTKYYNDISVNMGLLAATAIKPYLYQGGRRAPSATNALKTHGEPSGVDANDQLLAFTMVPSLTASLSIAAQYITGRLTSTTNCSRDAYTALQDAALNVQGLDDIVAERSVLPPLPDKSNPLAQKITDARCAYFLGLITKKIAPNDESAAVQGAPTGVPLKKP